MTDLFDAPQVLPERLVAPINAVVPPGATHIGFLCSDYRGNFLLSCPAAHPYGVTATWPKVERGQGETPAHALQRCLREQVGYPVISAYPLPAVWITGQSATFYFAGLTLGLVDEKPPITETGWATVKEVVQRMNASHNPGARRRDLGVWKSVEGMCLSPWRRVLLMVQALHWKGYERLRVCTSYTELPTWRCAVIPAHWTSPKAGGWFAEDCVAISRVSGHSISDFIYSSGHEQQPFDWEDASFCSPGELAELFLKRRQAIACAGWGPDPEYRRWYKAMIEATKPNGIVQTYPTGGTGMVSVDWASVRCVPQPPPGYSFNPEPV